jgi:hypothetical protein
LLFVDRLLHVFYTYGVEVVNFHFVTTVGFFFFFFVRNTPTEWFFNPLTLHSNWFLQGKEVLFELNLLGFLAWNCKWIQQPAYKVILMKKLPDLYAVSGRI